MERAQQRPLVILILFALEWTVGALVYIIQKCRDVRNVKKNINDSMEGIADWDENNEYHNIYNQVYEYKS